MKGAIIGGSIAFTLAMFIAFVVMKQFSHNKAMLIVQPEGLVIRAERNPRFVDVFMNSPSRISLTATIDMVHSSSSAPSSIILSTANNVKEKSTLAVRQADHTALRAVPVSLSNSEVVHRGVLPRGRLSPMCFVSPAHQLQQLETVSSLGILNFNSNTPGITSHESDI
jgi:hypothetical protein